ncbi:LOW QUALITY PROTEIN: ATP-binding cassette sub-family C member 10 [Boleophthalmus pectinirostris]|uniref:LOW QUALITY PROTEIN: ATP-binding cassette sub-family C member 10 n=1 Tax=Boleophthalmus pectinirostris TaxID=150288 RepID=UPI00242CC710|nr:LOW QUALITY PROTEIN: ATP-binding cassette sub-family C member 10 [Boleophthalmus pectinirostris]
MLDSSPSELLAALCISDGESLFPVWENGHVGICFNALVLGALPHAALAVASAAYLSVHRIGSLQSSPPCGWSLRLLSSVLLSLLFTVDLIVVSILHQKDMYLSILTTSCGLLGWTIHSGAIFVLQKSIHRRGRGPMLLFLLVLLSIPNLVFILGLIESDHYSNMVKPLKVTQFAVASSRAFVLLLYLLAYLFPCVRDAGYTLYVNAVDGSPLIPDQELDTGEMVGEDGSSFFSCLFYLWLSPLLLRGKRGDLNRPDDVYHLPWALRTSVISRHFQKSWDHCRGQTVLNQDNDWPSPVSSSHSIQDTVELEGDVSLIKVLHKAFGLKYYSLGLMKLTVNILLFSGPLLLSSLVNFIEEKDAPLSTGAWCAFGLFASTLMTSLIRSTYVFQISKVSLCARAALISSIYSKALRVCGSGLSGFSLGEVVNLMSTDTDRVVNFFNSFHELWSLPFRFTIALYLLYLQVGAAFLGGLMVALLLVPFNKFLASKIIKNNKEMLKHKDSRVKLMTEILFGIRVIKFYHWEPHFTARVFESRVKELSRLKALKYLDALCVYTWAALPVVISILTFVTYTLLGHALTAAKVFTTLALVGQLVIPLNAFAWVVNGILEAKVSLNRIQKFFKLKNQDLQSYYALVCPEDDQTCILLSQGTFSWQSPDQNQDVNQDQGPGRPEREAKGSLLLQGLNLHVTQGSLVVVVGKVGCGKSSLLAALTGELNRLSGVVFVTGQDLGFGLASQESWIQHASVRDNILFGKDYDPEFYQKVIEACALSDDLSVLPNGDRTEVGENGVTLSGGQKARLALARAVYMDKPIYLLDDPLAAVDTDVAEHLMKRCIMDLLKEKTRILCTHRIEFVDKANLVILMENGKIIKTGSPAEIIPLVEVAPKTQKNKDNKNENEDGGPEEEGSILLLSVPKDNDSSGEEQKAIGRLAWRVYRSYGRSVGATLASSVLLFLLLMQASKNVSDWWLSYWISQLRNNGSHSFDGSSPGSPLSPHLLLFSHHQLVSPLSSVHSLNNMSTDVKFYLTVYGGIAVSNTVFTALRAFLFAYGTICAATTIHNRLLDRVLKATVSFFDTTPLGRILNRFSSDIYTIDDSLPFVLNILLANVFGLMGILVVMSYGLPWVIVLLVPLALVYYKLQSFYRHTSRELKRLYSITLSPLYSHFSETITGLATIRATRSTARFKEENAKHLEQNQRCLFVSNAAKQWLYVRLQFMGVAVVTALAVIAVVQHQFKSVDPGLVGLALSYALSITLLLAELISNFTQMEMQMVSVERTEEYSTDLPTEPQDHTSDLPPSWPEQGWVEFRSVVLCYREGLPNALEGVSVVVRPGEKVGIVGRTGSGKSSLFLALFRMVELTQGQILLDGIDISTVGVHQLRSRLAIIPQDPFLFSGSVRQNLDPCERHSEQQLQDVLEQCHLSNTVHRMGGLDAEVGERGKSFSVGQRQLLCLARALLTQAKVLCIDEATASVDQKTDKLLQQTIRETFRDKTVLTIAHRINTILDCDRVLVMGGGQVLEFDSPEVLCQNESSVFHRLVMKGAGQEDD